jgi:hypothetical protein
VLTLGTSPNLKFLEAYCRSCSEVMASDMLKSSLPIMALFIVEDRETAFLAYLRWSISRSNCHSLTGFKFTGFEFSR